MISFVYMVQFIFDATIVTNEVFQWGVFFCLGVPTKLNMLTDKKFMIPRHVKTRCVSQLKFVVTV